MSDIITLLVGDQHTDEKMLSLQLSDFATITTLELDKSKRGDREGEADGHGFTLIGVYKVSAGREIMIGRRPQNRGGLFYVEFRDSSDAIIQGQGLIKLTNPARTKIVPVARCNTRELDSTNYLDRQNQPLLVAGMNVGTIWVTKDSNIELFFKPEVDLSVIDGSKTNIVLIEATVRWTGGP